MGTYICLIVVGCLCIISYKRFGGMMSPSVQLCGSFFVALFCFATQLRIWDTDLELNTMFIILWGLCFFICGELISTRVRIGSVPQRGIESNVNNQISNEQHPFYISSSVMVVLLAIQVVTLYFYFRFTYQISLKAGNIFGYAGMINYAYLARWDGVDTPKILTMGLVISRCFSCYCILILCHNIKLKYFKGCLVLFLPVGIYLVMTFLEGGRTSMIRIFIQIVITFIYVYGNKRGNLKRDIKLLKRIMLFVVLSLVLFNLYGVLRNSSYTGLEKIFRYPALPIQSLNIYLQNVRESVVFGEETLTSLRSILSRFGFETFSRPVPLEPVYWNDEGANIYTGLRRYYTDFGVLGVSMIMLFIGWFYGEFKKKVMSSKRIRTIILYGMFCYPIIEMIFEERFFIGLINFGTIYYYIGTVLLERIVRVRVLDK